MKSCLLGLIGSAVFCLGMVSAACAAPVADPGDIRIAKERLKLATETYQETIDYLKNDLVKANEPLEWAKRCLETNRAISTDKAERQKAVEEYQKRLLVIRAVTKELIDKGSRMVGKLDLKHIDYLLLEAEEWSTGLQTGK